MGIEKRDKTTKNVLDRQNVKWAKFTYIGRETRVITKLFKKSNVKIAFTTSNNLESLLKYHTARDATNKFNRNGVYQLRCPTCNKKYIGQTGPHSM
jgi:hypothetical protein